SFIHLPMLRHDLELHTLSLHDALPISYVWRREDKAASAAAAEVAMKIGDESGDASAVVIAHIAEGERARLRAEAADLGGQSPLTDRKSTRLNSSHVKISYAVFCLKKKK